MRDIPRDILCGKIKTQEETYYLHNIIIAPREIVFMLIVRSYNVVSNKSEHKYSPKTLASVLCSVRIYAKVIIQKFALVYENLVGTLTDVSNIFSSSEPISFSLVNTIRVKYL